MTLLVVLLFASGKSGVAQTWDEIFKQKKTQRRYLIEHVAALKLYAGYAWKGYTIANSGLQTINGLTSGELSLHEAFFNALKSASSVLTHHPKVNEIITLQLGVATAWGATGKLVLLAPEKAYVQLIRARVMKDCADDLWELALILSSNRTELAEAERLKRLDAIHASMTEKSVFSRWFAAQAAEQSLLRRLMESDNQILRILYENN